MKRKEFIKTCAIGCIGAVAGASLLSSCSSYTPIVKTPENNSIVLLESDFQNENKKFKRYIIVDVEGMQLPLVVYRYNSTSYSSYLLQCPHQGVELNVNGDLITCNAHGSEFDNKGTVLKGPAMSNLKSFLTEQKEDKIYINLV